MLAPLILAVAAAAVASPAAPSKAGPGAWRLSEVGGRIACTLTLTSTQSLGGDEVKAPLACRRAFPALKDLWAWQVDDAGAIAFNDAGGKRIMLFPPVAAGGAFEAHTADGKTWRLEPAAPVTTSQAMQPPVQRLDGEWKLTGIGGAPLCELRLKSDLFGGAGWVRPGVCAAANWTGKGLATWSLRAGRLTFYDAAHHSVAVLKTADAGGFVGADAKAEAQALVRR